MQEYEPTKEDAYQKNITLLGEYVKIDILDIAGQEDNPGLNFNNFKRLSVK